jgi:hypothetical protein
MTMTGPRRAPVLDLATALAFVDHARHARRQRVDPVLTEVRELMAVTEGGAFRIPMPQGVKRTRHGGGRTSRLTAQMVADIKRAAKGATSRRAVAKAVGVSERTLNRWDREGLTGTALAGLNGQGKRR